MKFQRLISDILVGHNTVFNNDQIHLINSDILERTQFKPICKRTITYIVGVVLLNNKNEVCLVQEAKESCKGSWYLPAGRVEQNENLLQAAIREAKEESGYVIEPLCIYCSEISRTSLWFRFMFIAKIVGGSLKTTNEADSESLQAKWFNIEKFNDKEFVSSLRSPDIIDQIKLAQIYYKKYEINSFTDLCDIDFIKLRDCKNLILPSHNSHENIVYTFVITSDNGSHCILYELNEESSVLPSVIMVPDVYLIRNHSFNYAIDSILLPACFKNPKSIEHHNQKFILAIDYNGKKETNKSTSQDGLHLIFLLKLKGSNQELQETIDRYKWEKIELVEELKQKLNQPFQFITLSLL